MGRQFSYFCCPEDLAEIERAVFQPLGGSLVDIEKRNDSYVVVPASSFALSEDKMGKETLFLYLLPPNPISNLVYSGPWLDHSKSHLVEVGRSYIKDRTIRRARFWYETRYLHGATFTEKPKEFIAWSQSVFRRTKATLERHSYQSGKYVYTEWFGQVAWRRVQEGALTRA